MAKRDLKPLVPKSYLEDRKSGDTDIQVSSSKAQRAPTVKKTFALPDYVARQLRLRAAKEGVTERYLLLKALAAAGIEVQDADLVKDGRSS